MDDKMFGIKLGTVDVSEHYVTVLNELSNQDELWEPHTSIELLPYSSESRQCNMCEKIRSETADEGEKHEPLTSSEPWYHARYSDIDICSECYPHFYENLVNTNENGRYKYCDVCIQDIGENPYYANEEAEYDVCVACFNAKRTFGVNVNQSGIETNRDAYIIAKHIEYDDVPSEFLSEITVERNKSFVNMMRSIVRAPDTLENILEWTLISDIIQCEHHDAECGFAVNVIDPKHPVASVLSDDHGRVAMNVVYETYGDYLREKNEYNKQNDMINFAEYIRMKRGIRFYYG